MAYWSCNSTIGTGVPGRHTVKIAKNIQPRLKHILLSPLDWGLGHTTRCMPLIEYLRGQSDIKIIIAGHEEQLNFLANRFPELSFELLEGYDVRYSSKGSQLKWRLLRQVPKILQALRREHVWLQDFRKKHALSGIISDNRYGLWHKDIPAVILTHQLQIQSGQGQLADHLLRRLHYRFLEKFREVWIVDTQEKGLAGTLSHPSRLPSHASYVGLLSQFYKQQAGAPAKEHKPLLILLSGPEPQRSLLSDLLWDQAMALQIPVLFVEGRQGIHRTATGQVQHTDQLQGTELLTALSQARMVICRAGYSSIMDLTFLNKNAILIPTPGQTEQEYLGKYLQSRQAFLSFSQSDFSLRKALDQSEYFPFKKEIAADAFQQFVPLLRQWLQGL